VRWFAIFITLIFIVGCSTPYEDSMRKGKDALKLGEYELAASQFEDALIESPRDEDAKILLLKAKEELNILDTKDKIVQYQKDIDHTKNKFNILFEQYKKLGKDGLSHQNGFNLRVLNSSLKDLDKIDVNYSKSPGILEINHLLKQSINSLIEYISSDGVFASSGIERSENHFKEFETAIKEVGYK
jgi:tetratricopeptide (TPR) repeat protein